MNPYIKIPVLIMLVVIIGFIILALFLGIEKLFNVNIGEFGKGMFVGILMQASAFILNDIID